MTIILNSINIDSLIKAHDNLKTILTQEVEYNIKRDASLKRFELAFELTWKVLKKIMNYKGVPCNGSKDVFRMAAKEGLIADPRIWIEYVDIRNALVHTYDDIFAEKTFLIIPSFSKQLDELIQNIKELK